MVHIFPTMGLGNLFLLLGREQDIAVGLNCDVNAFFLA